MKASCAIFIPAYNAEKTLASVLARIDDQTWKQVVEVFVINDGSTDNTGSIAVELQNRFRKLNTFSFEKNMGYGMAVRKGMQLCMSTEADYVLCLHADGQYPPECILRFLDYMQTENIDILQGSRHKSGQALAGGMPVYKYVAGKILVYMENNVLGLDMTDYHSGYIFYRKSALERLPFQKLSSSFDFDLEMIVLGKTLGMKISELEIPTRYENETSYLNPVTYGLRILRILYRYGTGHYHSMV